MSLPRYQTVQGGGAGLGNVREVPIDRLIPSPDHIVAKRIKASESRGGIIIPDAHDPSVWVAIKVGANVLHVQEGDVLLAHGNPKEVEAPTVLEVAGQPKVIRGKDIIAVIRGHKWDQ
jgi:co-chaperonin GroES (HSP10)